MLFVIFTQNSLFYFTQNFDRGLITSRLLSFRDLFKTELKVQPSDLAKYASLAFLPFLIKIIQGIIIDINLFSKKRTVMIVFGILSILAHIIIALGLSKDPLVVTGFLMIMSLA